MRDFKKVIFPIFLSMIGLFLGGLHAEDAKIKPKLVRKYTASTLPEDFTIAQYRQDEIKDGLLWSDEIHKFTKTENTYGIWDSSYGEWRRTGRWYFFVDGKLFKSTSFRDGKKDGREYHYSRHGFLQRRRTFSNGVEHGKSTTYTSKGNLADTYCFMNGRQFECHRGQKRRRR